jgi:hypothetical protein
LDTSISEVHLCDPQRSRPMLGADGSIGYRLGGKNVIKAQLENQEIIVSPRDVWHVRLACNRMSPTPLIGESPMLATIEDWLARPSAVLSTDIVLDKDAVQQLRDRWNEQSKFLHGGGTPILTAGLKATP